MKKRILAPILSLAMVMALCVGILPVGASALSWQDPYASVIGEFSEGLAYVTVESFFDGDSYSSWTGYIDTSGNAAIALDSYPSTWFVEYPPSFNFSEGLAIVYGYNEKFGYIDKTGKEVIPCEYYDASPFNEGLAAVCNEDNELGYIDKTGNVVIPFQHDYYWAESFSESLAAVCNVDGKSGYIDKTGNVIIPFEYVWAESFSESLAAVCNEDYEYGYIDKTGNVVIAFEYYWAESFSEGLAAVCNEDWEYGYIDKTGNVVIPFEYDYYWAGSFSEGLAAVCNEDDKYGYIDKTGNVVIPFEYDYADSFSEGLAVVLKDDKYGFIDKSGNLVIPYKYDSITNFSEGCALYWTWSGDYWVGEVGVLKNPLTDTPTPTSPFTDVKPGDWYYDAVVFCNDNGIMSGAGGGAFNPGGTLNRAMMATLLYNLEGSPSVTYSPVFSDVPGNEWYSSAIVWAAGNSVVGGVGGGAFNPNGSITREQMAAMLYNYAKYNGYDISAAADLSGFPDAGAVSNWARDAMRWAVAEGLVSGTGGKLNPVGTASRAECATIILRFVENIS